MPTGPRSGGVARRRSVDHASAASPHASTPYSGSRKCAGRTGFESGNRSAITRPASGTTHGQRSAAAVPSTNAPMPPTPAATTSNGERSTASERPGACASISGIEPATAAAIPTSRSSAPRSTSSSATPSAATRPAIGSSSSDVTARRESRRGVSAGSRDAHGPDAATGVRDHHRRLAGQLGVDLEHGRPVRAGSASRWRPRSRWTSCGVPVTLIVTRPASSSHATPGKR